MSSPLNINLLIPFKDNKGLRLNLYRREIEAFRSDLDARVADFREDLISLFGKDFELNLSSRSDGNTKKYYWRFKSAKRDRKYNRLHAESVSSYLLPFGDERWQRVKSIEEELIYINANLKLIKGMLDAIDQSETELNQFRQAIR